MIPLCKNPNFKPSQKPNSNNFPFEQKKKKKRQRPRKQSSIQALKLRNLSGGNKKKNQITKGKMEFNGLKEIKVYLKQKREVEGE